MAARLDTSPCPCPTWLIDGHTQTIYGAFLAHRHRVHFVRERISTPDGDFLDLDWSAPGLDPDSLADGTPAVRDPSLQATAAARWLQDADWYAFEPAPHTRALVLFHGLEGSSRSHYAQAIAHHFRTRGWVVVIAHFRGCSGFANRMARAYYSGDTTDVSFILQAVQNRLPEARWHAVGVSLGGNALLKFLGSEPDKTQGLRACAALSVPMDLMACGRRLSEQWVGRQLYTRHFLKSMKRKLHEKATRFPGVIDLRRLEHVRTLKDFDDMYTAPMHGYADAHDYWERASSKPWIKHIKLATLVLNARNDPFIPTQSLVSPEQASQHVVLHYPAQGGHAGFVTGRFPGTLSWLTHRIARFFENS